MSIEEQILEELKAIRQELQRTKVESGFYTTEESIIKIGYKSRVKAGAAILRELKKSKMLTDFGMDKWSKQEVDKIAPLINTELFFSSDNNYKLIKAA